MITFKELRYVTLLNKHKNFSQAAKHAGISQPALSMAISKLEEKLDLKLFYRDTNGMVRSNIYSDFLSNEGGNIIKNVDDVLLRLKSITKKNTGSVVFGVGNIVAESILPGALKSFCSKNKEVYPNFISGYWYELREKLLRQEINFFITANHLDAVDDEITQEDFIKLKVNFFARIDHPLTKLDKIKCFNLIEYPVITYHTVSSKKYIFDRLETQQQIDKLEKNFPAGNLESVKLAVPIVSETDYLIMSPEKFFKYEVNQGLLKVIEIDDFDLTLKIKLVTRSNEILSPIEVEMVENFGLERDTFVGR
jgi:DNA-binding transcriptional LysR family regulator